ncbi:uncharacterized protein PITG_12003 [Phytophthora infestans T30-4]|uniref:Reverse transcriptase zinc-binding domain-containing protein n=1 Tax=Phytophthora infestans (strain T30-4) TaxID=403677 RepID=D0NHQ8_PHYIT|nr:uncharacterized protein PITG_12003 [Phytophthora infestans T30-4]EEY58983.1 conserved hypothetical protein [Phytophthora infestans T30-4]|eukprot:XP_002901456.1 conserved hypothetical protein [Phytophthora infestans T30-4]
MATYVDIHTKFFLALVDDFCVASGMSLNKDKTVVLPFQPWTAETEPLRQALVDLGMIVVGNTGRTKLLGSFYGPNLSDADRLQHLLFEMKTRCSLWLHRARTLRGQVVILQQVILPVLWYTASVCHIPQTGFQNQLLQLISRFICRFRSSNAPPRAWWFLPPHNGGLNITPICDMIKSLQLHMLCKVILAERIPPATAIPSWVEPVIRLFDLAVAPWGRDFDILYAPVSTSPDYVISRRSPRWTALGAYWHFVLFTWNTHFRGKAARLQVKFDKMTTPLLDNADIAYSYRGSTLAGTSRPLGLIAILAEQGILRPLELFRACETPVTAETLSLYLSQFVTGRISSVRSCASFPDKAGGLLGLLTIPPIGPSQTVRYYAASHTWVFDTYEVAELSVARIRNTLVTAPTPDLPLFRLGVERGPPQSMWIRDIKMGKHVLPVYSDLLYRLQHNALFFGYRLQHIQEAQRLCHHDCGVLETAPHLFWYCDFAARVWNDWIPTFQRLFTSSLEWESLLWFKITPTPSAKTSMATASL